MMKTRTITQVLVYQLVMNMMRNKAETPTLVAVATDKEALIKWIEEQKETWTDGSIIISADSGDNTVWHKNFKKGSPLEWFNPIEYNELNPYGHGIHEAWISEEAYRQIPAFHGKQYIAVNYEPLP